MNPLSIQILILFLTFTSVMGEERRISVCKTCLNQIYTMLRDSPQDWRNFVGLARTLISHLDETTFMQQTSRTQEQVWTIATLQKLAFMDADNGGVIDVASWCSQQWLTILQRKPDNLAALRGIGQAWLSRAQPSIAKIHQSEGRLSSSTGSQRSITSTNSSGNSASTAEAERRAHTAEYVEARGFLQPAVDYLERAVTAATSQRILSGDVLATAAEAYMSLGNTSSPRCNERHFVRAIELLRAADSIQGYVLDRYLQRYLDEYGRVVEG